MLAAVDAQGLEGVVAKRLDSRYEPGQRSRAWIKTPIRRTCSVAVPDAEGSLVYAGDCGTGFSQATRAQLCELPDARGSANAPVAMPHGRSHRWRAAGPLAQVRWAEPGLVGDIAYRQFTRDGSFRHRRGTGCAPISTWPISFHRDGAQPQA